MVTTTPPGRPESPGAQHPPLVFTDPGGRQRSAPARFGPSAHRDAALPLRARRVLLGRREVQCVQVFLSRADAAQPAARALLDTEAGTALHLARALEGTPYPYLFPSVVGYELDAAEPFLLYAAPRGVPVGRTQLTSAADHRVFARDLALALCLLDGEGLVPRGVSPATVHWDGTALQLWGLEGAARIGRPRSPWGRAPYCSPEQRRGEGHVDARDAVWSAAQVLYQVVTGRAGPADRAPEDLARHRALAGTLPRAFAPAAAGRPTPAALLELLAPEDARRLLPVAAGAARTRHEAFERTLEAKRRASAPLAGDPASGADGAAGAEAAPGDVLCPYCLEEIRLDLSHLYVTDDRNQYQPLDLSGITNPVRRDDAMRAAVQRCAADPDFPDHYIPVPYLTHGRPLTVAMIGQSSAGKSHLLTQMIAEITDGGLRRYGVDWQSVNPEQHARFVRERVQPLRSGKVLAHTGSVHDFAQFVESLLLTDAHGRVRPVAFFDLGGEDLVRTDEVLRFLLGVDALIFVVDPVLALPLPQLDSLRADLEVEVDRDGDTAFGTVLDRLPRKGPYLETPAVMVLGKADLLRFQPPVDRWLEEGPAAAIGPDQFLAESADVHALLHRHAGQAWLRPFDAFRRCTLHVASATGGRESGGRYPAGARPRRVLEPLVSLLAMHGIIEAPGGAASFGVGREAQ
ncbi:hypothetical protein IPZ64_22135 [Streptomyces violaceoruber]|uniref:hypothetical protein n=1 Tax=Streptomyces violaceoruber TaxID=1935 RepID=UPI001F19423E|nr:hypothetical protein [Streptomyces violaceoruber]MCF3169598.1 hypothetical protein [Streptomyces violaceoruber]